MLLKNLVLGLQIFDRYGVTRLNGAEHDIIYICDSKNVIDLMTDEDYFILDDLGFEIDLEINVWYFDL